MKGSLARFANQNAMIPPTPLMAPDPFEPFPGTQTAVKPITKTSTLTVRHRHDGHRSAMEPVGAVRFDHFHARFDQGRQGLALHPYGQCRSPRAAVVYKPDKNEPLFLLRHIVQSVGGNPDAVGVEPGAGAGGDHTFEMGGKIQVLEGQLAVTTALFSTEKANARISDPSTRPFRRLAGTDLMNGVELGAQGHITDHWELIAAIHLLAPPAVGLVAAGILGPIPNPRAIRRSGRPTISITASRSAAASTRSACARPEPTRDRSGQRHSRDLPAYVTWDAMISYPVTDNLPSSSTPTIRKRILLREPLITRPNENHAEPGPGRTFLLTAAVAL